MLSDDLHCLVGMAFVDPDFCRELLRNPEKATATMPLSSFDRRAIRAGKGAGSLPEFSARMASWVQHAAAHGRAPDGYLWPEPAWPLSSEPLKPLAS